jgi:hypothetical protein
MNTNTEIYINEISLLTATCRGTKLSSETNQANHSDWFDAKEYLGKKGHRYYSEPVKYALAAAKQLDMRTLNGEKVGVFLATDTADREVRTDIYRNISRAAIGIVSPAFAPNSSVNMAASSLAEKYGIHGPNFTLTGDEGSACIALWRAIHQLRRKEIEMALVGQVEYLKNEAARSGALLWRISNTPSSKTLLTIKYKSWSRWLPHFEKDINFVLEGGRHNIYLIGSNNQTTSKVMSLLGAMNRTIVHIGSAMYARHILPSMHLFYSLSILALQQIDASVFLVSDKGHIFHYQLTYMEKSNEQY